MIELRGKAMGRALAALVAAGLALPACASAWTVGQDLQIAYRAAPQGPCAGHLTVHWKFMPHADGSVDEADLGPGMGMRVVKVGDGPNRLQLLSCDVALNPLIADDGAHECDTIVHEYLHTAGHRHEEGGVMTPYTGTWPACHSARERVTDAVLARAPRGWAVECGPRQGWVMRCTADDGRHHARRFRARAWDADWSGFSVVRVRRGR